LPRDTTVRQRIIDLLRTNGPIEDASGRATSVLKESVGYEQSDAGFSQLVSAMERDGQITREIRGKRTFKISGTAPAEAVPPSHPSAVEDIDHVDHIDRVDYDELAAALLARTVQVLGNAQEPAEASGWARRRIEQLQGRVDELQRELARARAEAKTFMDERDELRGQLEAASHNLNLLAERSRSPRPSRAAERLGSDEQALLYELRAGQDTTRKGRAG